MIWITFIEYLLHPSCDEQIKHALRFDVVFGFKYCVFSFGDFGDCEFDGCCGNSNCVLFDLSFIVLICAFILVCW